VIISLVSCSDRVRSVPVLKGCEKLIINVGNDTCYSLNSTISNAHKMCTNPKSLNINNSYKTQYIFTTHQPPPQHPNNPPRTSPPHRTASTPPLPSCKSATRTSRIHTRDTTDSWAIVSIRTASILRGRIRTSVRLREERVFPV
jgi:hypothetical protein